MRIKCTYHLSDFMVGKLEKEIGESSSSTRPVGLAGLVIPSDDPMVMEKVVLALPFFPNFATRILMVLHSCFLFRPRTCKADW